MWNLDTLRKPWLLLPTEWAHHMSPFALKMYSFLFGQSVPEWKSFDWRGLHFANPLGTAGGVDKNAEHLSDWSALGCGFLEVGTITPQPQTPNSGKIMARHLPQYAMWNKMGFPSDGAEEVFLNLKFSKPEQATPIFVNIGKNRQTPNERATEDYLALLQRFRSVADVFVVNISSPNTQGLRELQKREYIAPLLSPLIEEVHRGKTTPLLVKLSPDMGDEGLAETLHTCTQLGVDGFVLTNTTLSRPADCPFPVEGGLSGAPLKDLSRRALEIAVQTLGKNRKDMLLVSAGGILTPEDVFERLQMGADLVQIYSALVFQGPGFFLEVARRYNDER